MVPGESGLTRGGDQFYRSEIICNFALQTAKNRFFIGNERHLYQDQGPRGQHHEVDASTDMNMNLMEVVRSYELAPEGTLGICGGIAMCASCQCYVYSDHELPEKSDDEEAMLSEAFFVNEKSRLGCQILITTDLNGLEVELAPEGA